MPLRSHMKNIVTFLILSASVLSATASPPPISPDSVAVLYNNQEPESEELARTYALARDIPRANLVGLEL
jgi:hypothetical protein